MERVTREDVERMRALLRPDESEELAAFERIMRLAVPLEDVWGVSPADDETAPGTFWSWLVRLVGMLACG
jgi:uncharacterized protein (DUF2384 family)